MPARARLRLEVAADLSGLARLRAVVEQMTPAQVQRFAASLDSDDLALLEQVVQDVTGSTWREHPAAFAAHLTEGEYKRWPYVELLSARFAAGIRGISEPWVDSTSSRQLWNLPSQYGKTTLLVTYGVPWALDFDPRLRIIYITYDADKAVEEGGKARDFAEAHADVLRFKLRADRRARGMWRTEEGGGLYCVGVNGGITGWPADVAICDDLLKGWQAAHSEAQRDHTWNVYRSQIRLRMQKPTSPIFIVGTRWHEQDPTGKALAAPVDPAGVDDWLPGLVRLPAIAESPQPDSPDPILRAPDPLGREPGQALEPERFPVVEVIARQTVLGSYLWAAMEQQRPAPEEGNDIKRAWWKIDDQLPAHFDDTLTSWDMKLKDKEAGDFVVGQAWGRTGTNFWLIDQVRGQWNQASTKVAIALLAVRHPYIVRHVIENTGNAPEVMDELRRADENYVLDIEVASALGVTEHEYPLVQDAIRRGVSGMTPNPAKGDKRVRMRAVSPLIEAGNVHLPAFAPWLPTFLDELSAFPNGSFDDQVDACSQGLSKLRHGDATFAPAEHTGSAAIPQRQLAPVRSGLGAGLLRRPR